MPFPSRGWLLYMSFRSKLDSRDLPTKHRNDAVHAVMIAQGGRRRLARGGHIGAASTGRVVGLAREYPFSKDLLFQAAAIHGRENR
ncbi:MAG TPA: hypothetical protein VGY58_03635 [Gemmataceae bacterium]|jgi:hypothetical protein|nr:hypothetical protein [Gemmataceae bacterium]